MSTKKFGLILTTLLFLNTLTYGNPSNKKWGISLLNVNQREKGKITHGNFSKLPFHDGKINVDAKIKLLKLDYFPYPFLGFYGIGGTIDAKATIENIKMKLGPISVPIKKHITKKSEGYLYGGGILLGGAYKNIFLLGQYTYTEIHLKGDVASKKAEVYTSRLGYTYRVNEKITINPYGAITYQESNANITGTIKNYNFNFNVELEEIIPSAGILFTLPYDFTLVGEYSFGKRQFLALELGYRF